VAAIDQAAAEAALCLFVLVEMHLRGVLVEAGRELVLGLLDGHRVDVVDLFANLVVAPAVAAAG